MAKKNQIIILILIVLSALNMPVALSRRIPCHCAEKDKVTQGVNTYGAIDCSVGCSKCMQSAEGRAIELGVTIPLLSLSLYLLFLFFFVLKDASPLPCSLYNRRYHSCKHMHKLPYMMGLWDSVAIFALTGLLLISFRCPFISYIIAYTFTCIILIAFISSSNNKK